MDWFTPICPLHEKSRPKCNLIRDFFFYRSGLNLLRYFNDSYSKTPQQLQSDLGNGSTRTFGVENRKFLFKNRRESEQKLFSLDHRGEEKNHAIPIYGIKKNIFKPS